MPVAAFPRALWPPWLIAGAHEDFLYILIGYPLLVAQALRHEQWISFTS